VISQHIDSVRTRRVSPGAVESKARSSAFRLRRTWALGLAALLVVAEVLTGEATELNRIRHNPDSGVDYKAAVEYVAAHHRPGQPIYVALPAPAYIAVGSKEDLVFVSGKLDDPLASVYALRTNKGGYVDYWVGAPAIVTTAQLCDALLLPQKYWLVVDGFRLGRDWAYEGEMAQVMMGLTSSVDPNWPKGIAMVRRAKSESSRDPAAMATCRQAIINEGLDEPRFTPRPH
jgi:hypothetical protein